MKGVTKIYRYKSTKAQTESGTEGQMYSCMEVPRVRGMKGEMVRETDVYVIGEVKARKGRKNVLQIH